MRSFLLVSVLLTLSPVVVAAEPNPCAERGTVHFRPTANEATIPERYRLSPRDLRLSDEMDD